MFSLETENYTKGYGVIFKMYTEQLRNWWVNHPSRDEYTKLHCGQLNMHG